jgi:Predicted solute binding protein
MPLSDRDRRTLRIGGIVAGVLVVGLVLLNVLGGGGGTEAPPRRTTGSATPTLAPTATPTTTPTPVARFTGRDPFSTPPQFLVATGTSGTGSSSSGGSSSSSALRGPARRARLRRRRPSRGGIEREPGRSHRGPPGHLQGERNRSRAGGDRRCRLQRRRGEQFGPGNRFELRSVSGNCGTFVFGDQSFTLCITPSK